MKIDFSARENARYIKMSHSDKCDNLMRQLLEILEGKETVMWRSDPEPNHLDKSNQNRVDTCEDLLHGWQLIRDWCAGLKGYDAQCVARALGYDAPRKSVGSQEPR